MRLRNIKGKILNTVRKKVIFYSLLATLLMSVMSIYTYYNARMFLYRIDDMFTGNVFLKELNENVVRVDYYLESYLSTKYTDNLEEFISQSEELRRKAQGIQRDNSHDENTLLLKDIGNMIDVYLEEADAAVNAKRGRDINEYINRYNEASKIAGYINYYINKMNLNQFQKNTDLYLLISRRLNMLQILNIIMITNVIILNIIIIFWFAVNFTRPIERISHSADEMSKGNFDVEEVVVDSNDETRVMAEAFNRMKHSIKNYIEELKARAELEERFVEQKMQNLKMKNLLKNAELQALQSQINPHFLFNTLNAGVQLAMFEGADTTCTFLEEMSNLFRYNIRELDKPVTLKEEINNLLTYVYLIKTRYADQIRFEYEVDETTTDILMPALILQPLIENAFIHGIGDMEQGGKIRFDVYREKEGIQVIIEDNGKGISHEKLMNILNDKENVYKPHDFRKTGHTTGIGLGNVIHRLRLFFGRDDVINIISSEGRGTSVVLSLPHGE